MRTAIKSFVTLSLFLTPLLASSFDHQHTAWTKELKKYQTKEGLVRYAQLQSELKANTKHPFAQYIKSLSAVKYDEYQKWQPSQQMAFLINAYNALTIQLIVDHYPVKSIKKIGSLFKKPWSIEFFSLLDGKIKSLDPLEHEWLRPQYKDYRIHAAVNCASISCPPLRNEAFVGEDKKLQKQLDEQMRIWLADSSRNQLNPTGGEYAISKIFDWYGKDFEQWGKGVLSVVNQYAPQPLAAEDLKKIKIKFLDYDWNLNVAP